MSMDKMPFEQYFGNAFNDLSGMLEQVLPSIWPDSHSAAPLRSVIPKLLFNDFWLLFLDVAGADHRIKASEASVLQSIAEALGITFSEGLIQEGKSLSNLYAGFRETLADTRISDRRSGLIILDALELYDAKKGTTHAEEARELYYQVVYEIVIADRQVTEEEEAKLSSLKKTLWPS